MQPSSDVSGGERLLHALKTRGPQSAAELARRLGFTATAARQHLGALAAEGLVAFAEERRPRGRPARVWRLTEAGSARFPEGYGELALELLAGLRATFGPEGVDQLVAHRTRAQRAAYRAALPGREAPLHRRVAALARLRTREGYMAESRKQPDGSVLLVENHCPICAAAQVCQGLCAAELELFAAVLGPGVLVERTEHLLAGARRCAYRVRER